MDKEKELEQQYLSETTKCISSQIKNCETFTTTLLQEVKALTEHINDNFNLDAREIAFTISTIRQKNNTLRDTEKQKNMLTRVLPTPYFAKLKFESSAFPESDFYLGLRGIWEKDKVYVMDWRTPMGALYYNGSVGLVSYLAPEGIVTGDLKYKRQFKIENGGLQYYFDTTVKIDDSVLQEALSKNSSIFMQNIVKTIQQEQDVIIRQGNNVNVVLDGVAGSGKTSIAMHRIAYLLFAHKESINYLNTLIVSPNKLFTKYIGQMLPELGEENVLTSSMIEILGDILNLGIKVTSRSELIEAVSCGNLERYEDAKIKYSFEYFLALKNFLTIKNDVKKIKELQIEECLIPTVMFEKMYYVGEEKCDIFASAQITSERLADYFFYKFSEVKQEQYRQKIKKHILHSLLSSKLLVLIKEFFRSQNLSTDELSEDKINYEDLSTYAFFSIFTKGDPDDRVIKQVFVDEMQDYDSTTIFLLKKLYKEANITIVGDFKQNLLFTNDNKQAIFTAYPNAKLFRLENSYRCTNEITQFAFKILGEKSSSVFIRHGEEPQVIQCDDIEDNILKIREKVKYYSDMGLKRIAIICKNQEESKRYSKLLPEFYFICNEEDELKNFNNLVLSVHLSKGLEFDGVIVPNASCENYVKEIDKQVLFVACTRALHELAVFCVGEPSQFLPK